MAGCPADFSATVIVHRVEILLDHHCDLEDYRMVKLTQIELPLTAIADFGKLGKTDPLFAKLDEITKRHNGLWSAEAEKYLLANK